MIDFNQIDKSWTLFLDRDGVLNYEKPMDYIYNYHEFVFYEGAKDALRFFSGIFNRIILTTNQRGVGKGLMTGADLDKIHSAMLADIEAAGGRIDKIYVAPGAEDDDPIRKPRPAMAFMAKTDFPEIEFSKSIMIGNNLSDTEFGRNAGIRYSIFLKTTHPELPLPQPSIDMAFDTLEDFAKAWQNS